MIQKSYLDLFFEEKEIHSKIFEIEAKGTTHFVENDFVIELIKKTPASEKKQIENILRKIDFANGDVNHFLEHLAKGYVMNNY